VVGSDTSGNGATPPGAHRTVVTLTFNDGKLSQYRFARPLLRHHRMNATFYVSTGRVDHGDACCMGWTQVQDLYRDGDEIGGLGRDHVDLTVTHSPDPTADYAYKKKQVCEDRQRLRGLGLDPRSFAYPGGAYKYSFPGHGDLTDLIASCGYLSGRTVGGLSRDGAQSSLPLPPDAPYAVRTPDEVSLEPITLTELQQAVIGASQSSRRWLPLAFGEVCHLGDPTYKSCLSSRRPVEDTVLAGFLDWLGNAGKPGGAPPGTDVKTMRKVMGAPPQPPLPSPPTVVSLTFDDGDATQARAGELLRARRMHATFYLNTGFIDRKNPYNLTWPQVMALRADGNDIGGHTADHVDLTDPKIPLKDRRDQVCRDRQRLLDKGMQPESFAYPFGASNQEAQDIVKGCGYLSARTASGVSPDGPVYAEKLPPANWFATAALSTAAGPQTLASLQHAVLTAADTGGGWLPMVLHRVCRTTDPTFANCMTGEAPVDDETFAAFLDWLKHGAPKGTTVRTVKQVLSGTH
jgi:peptidoglycan/xylan/chitin deacetylase (PgdA/CDA1 family)